MSLWNHQMCGECWIEREVKSDIAASHRVIRCPVLLLDVPAGVCCFCGQRTRIGLFIRHDPKELSCKHPCEHADTRGWTPEGYRLCNTCGLVVAPERVIEVQE